MHITIITPSLNYGRFLGECLKSVAAQLETGKQRRNLSADMKEERAGRPHSLEIEHLVIDGDSADDSAEMGAGFTFPLSNTTFPLSLPMLPATMNHP